LLEIGLMPARTIVTTPNDKHKEYSRYAAHCLTTAAASDQETRAIQREMTAEWLNLAEAALHPLKRKGTAEQRGKD
jgi:hypothetical protein